MSEPGPIDSRRAPKAIESVDAANPPSLPLQVTLAVWAVILAVAMAGLYFFYTRGYSNLYGDGIAHMEGARRLFDSLNPGYPEIGTVWLPLFHLVAAPFTLNDFLWRTGLAGSLVSTAAFILVAWFIFRLAFELNRNGAAAALALAGFLLCPNNLYLASTPLTEPLALLWTVLVVYGLFRFRGSGRTRALVGSAVAAFFGTLTRYDAWYLLPFATLFVLLARQGSWPLRLRRAALFAGVGGLGPFLWILHNAFRFGNPLEFYNGPFSAQAIYAHQLATLAFRYPTDGSLVVAARYYLSDLKLVIGIGPVVLSAFGLLAWALDRRDRARRAAVLLLLVPLPFYVHALAYAAVPLYVPTQFPNTYYNLRYGLAMVAATSVLPSFWLSQYLPRKTRSVLVVILLGILLAQALSTFSHGVSQLAVLREGVLNTPCRSKRQEAVTRFLREHYDGERVLMALGQWPCVMPQVGIPYHQTLTQANRPYWLKMRSKPEELVEWIIRGDGDAVDELMRAYPHAFNDFELLKRESLPGEEGVSIYRRRFRRSGF